MLTAVTSYRHKVE